MSEYKMECYSVWRVKSIFYNILEFMQSFNSIYRSQQTVTPEDKFQNQLRGKKEMNRKRVTWKLNNTLSL